MNKSIYANFLETANGIIELLNNGVRKKSAYKDAAYGLSDGAEKVLNAAGYVYKEDARIHLLKKPEEEMDDAKKISSDFKSNIVSGLSPFADYWGGTRMHDFLEMYHIGFCREITFDGKFNFTIGCLMTKSSVKSKISADIDFKNQMERLMNYGFEMGNKTKCGNLLYLKATQNNIELVYKLLESINGKLIRISITEDRISEIKFIILANEISSLNMKAEEHSFEVADELNKDEVADIIKALGIIPPADFFSDGKMLQTCGSLLEYTVHDVCKALGYETKIYSDVEARHADNRKMYKNASDLRKKIGKQFPADKAKDVMAGLTDTLEGVCINKMGCTVSNFVISQYGVINAELRPIQEEYASSLTNAKKPSQEEMEKDFDTCGLYEDSNLYILDTPKSQKTIRNKLIQLLNAQVTGYETRNYNGHMTIQTIKITIPETELNALSKMAYEKDME